MTALRTTEVRFSAFSNLKNKTKVQLKNYYCHNAN